MKLPRGLCRRSLDRLEPRLSRRGSPSGAFRRSLGIFRSVMLTGRRTSGYALFRDRRLLCAKGNSLTVILLSLLKPAGQDVLTTLASRGDMFKKTLPMWSLGRSSIRLVLPIQFFKVLIELLERSMYFWPPWPLFKLMYNPVSIGCRNTIMI